MPDVLQSHDGLMNYSAMYRDVFNFQRKYTPPRLGDDEGESYWREISVDMVGICNQYGNTRFIKEFVLAVTAELEREFEAVKSKEGIS